MIVFISYAHEDQARMLVVAEAVRAAGHTVEADVDILRGGDDFARRIEASIGACDACVVLWSKASCSKPWVPAEANHALSAKKRVISIKVEDCSPPLPFSTFHMLDLTKSSDLGPLLRSLDPRHAAAPPKRSPWPMRLLGAAVGVVALSVGAWLAIPSLQEKKVPPPPPMPAPMAAVDAGAPPQAPAPDAGPAPEVKPSKPPPKVPAPDPCAALKARFQKVEADCQETCDLDHYPMREDLDRCRTCDNLRTQVTSCSPSRP